MNCYFCNHKLNINEPDIFTSHSCKSCAENANVHDVVSTAGTKEDTDLLYAHIYIRSPDYKLVNKEFKTSCEDFSYTREKVTTFLSSEQIGKNIQVRLNLRENRTFIISHYYESGIPKSKEVKVLEGSPINPKNAAQKLEIILLLL